MNRWEDSTMNRLLSTTMRVGAGIALITAALATAPAGADSVADFYRGKLVTVYVGYSVGGGYDLYARTLARHMGRNIPGNPDFVVKNRPGAGSLVLANEIYNTHPKDGTAFGTVGRGMPMEPMFGNKKALFDATKYTWLGSMNNEVSLCVSWHDTPIKTVDDMFTKKFIVGGTGRGADTDAFPLVFNNVLGAKIKLVTGYPGGNDINFAMERGEVHGRCAWSWSSVKSTRANWLRDKKVNLLLQMSTSKHPELPNVPFVMDYAKTDRERQIFSIIYARQVWGRPFIAPPGLPADRAKALQKAFMDTMADPIFLAEAKKINLDLAPVSGPEVQKLIAELAATPKELLDAAAAATLNRSKTEIDKAVIPIEMLSGTILKLKNGGRSVTVGQGGKKQKVKVSGRRTAILVGGAKKKRKALKLGMACTLTYQGSTAKKIDCK